MSGNPHPPTPSQAGLLRRVSLTIILVSDLRRSVSFYRDQLGLTLTAETSEWAEFRVGETRLALQTGGDPGLPRSRHAAGRVSFSFEVEDVVESYEVLRAAGVAALTARACAEGAWYNALINLKGLKDPVFVADVTSRADRAIHAVRLGAEEVAAAVQAELA